MHVFVRFVLLGLGSSFSIHKNNYRTKEYGNYNRHSFTTGTYVALAERINSGYLSSGD